MYFSPTTLLSLTIVSSSWISVSAFGTISTLPALAPKGIQEIYRRSTSNVAYFHSDTSLFAKKILLAFDGTGNNARDFEPNEETDKSFTNVLTLHLLAGGDINGRRNDIPGQISLYERGIGARSGKKLIKTLRMIGGDLGRQTKPMRKRLEEVYEKGDKLYIIGFSRGAAAARKFSTELYKKGLLTKDGDKVDEPPIEFLGCFETVSMQLKKRFISILAARRGKHITKSTVLGEDGAVAPNVKKAVHNVALDDNRMFNGKPSFPPVLMGSEDRVHETWFAGEHGDVGGNFYSKGIPDCSCKHMQEWIESLNDSISFIEAKDINPECLTIDGHPYININASDLSIIPDPTDKIHLGKFQVETPSYRPVHVVQDDEVMSEATVSVHESVLYHMEAMKEKGTPYAINPELKETKFVIVGPLGKELEAETNRFSKLLESV